MRLKKKKLAINQVRKINKSCPEVTVKNTKKRKKQYFGKEAHNSIVRYQTADDRSKKHEIYISEIKPSFDKLAENLIFIHGFSTGKEHFKTLKSDCVTFLYETLEKFNPERGSKAFSYFNVCAKNFLIIQSKKRIKALKRHVSIHDNELKAEEKKAIENYQIIPSQEDIMIRKEDKILITEILLQIKRKLTNQNELACINAIITLFGKIQDLDFLNKRAVFVYLRELSGLNPKQLSVSMSNIRKLYKDLVKSNDEFVLFI